MLGFISLFLIITCVFSPLGFVLFEKWLDLKSERKENDNESN